MDFQYYGGNCVRITTKNASFVFDDNLSDLGAKSVTKPDDVALFTHQPKKNPDARLVIADPGEYEVSEVSIFGVAARGHMQEKGEPADSTMYKLQFEDTRVAIVGHVHPDLSEDQLEELGVIDILVVPVGGNGFTLDAIGATQLIKKIEPKIVIPTHYADKSLKYEVPQAELDEAVKNLGMEPKEKVSKFKPKPTDYTEAIQLLVLEKQ